MVKTLKSSLDCKEIQPIHPKGNQSWIFIGRTSAEPEAPILWPPDEKGWLIRKDPDTGKDWMWQEDGTTEDEMVWHHQLDGHEFVQSPGVGNGQGRLACCSPWVSKESDTTERLNGTELNFESTCSPWIDSNKPITYSRASYFLDTTKSVPCSPWLFTLLLNAIPVWTFLAEFSYRVWVHMANMLLLILSVHYYMLCVS